MAKRVTRVWSQSFAEAFEYRFEHFDTSEALVVRFYDVPSAILGAGAFDHLARCRFVVVGLGSVAVVFFGDLELLVGRPLTFFEPSQLLLGADVEPKFDHYHPVLYELGLEVVDLLIGPPPIGLRRKTLDALHQHASVPAAIVDGEATS